MIKTYILLTIFLLSTFSGFSQREGGFNYQAVIRSGGETLSNQAVTLGISIINSEKEVHYFEEHSDTTNPYGQISILIGQGLKKEGDLSTLNWSTENYSIQVEVNGDLLTSSPIIPVPVALYAERSKTSDDWVSEGDSVIYHSKQRTGLGNHSPSEMLVVGDDLGNITAARSSIVIGDVRKERFSKITMGESEDNWGAITWRNSETSTPNTFLFGIKNDGLLRDAMFSINQEGKVGIGTSSPKSPLHIRTDNIDEGLTITTEGVSEIVRLSLSKWQNSLEYGVLSLGGNTRIRGNGRPSQFDGDVSVSVLEIRGGADITEPFEMSSNDLDPGTLLVIDPASPGRLMCSSSSYDSKVAGVISGAGGVNAGLKLSQEEILDQGQDVTIAGRVYVRACDQNGPIKPGDLLTSSDLPGTVMRVKNHRKARGAVIGKALTGLQENGFVLTLISLQ